MRTFQYNEYGDTGGNFPINEWVVTKTEQQILDVYFPYWKSRMIKAGKEDLISEERCIEDWCSVNWAWEITDQDG